MKDQAEQAANAVFQMLDSARRADSAVRRLHAAFGEKEAFKGRISDLNLGQWLDEFLHRKPIIVEWRRQRVWK